MTLSNDRGAVFAIEWATGAKLWRFETDPSCREQNGQDYLSAPSVVDEIAIICSKWKGIVHALDTKTGVELWKFDVGGRISSDPVVIDGVLYLGIYGALCAFRVSE